MNRKEFTPKTKQLMLERSGGFCEAHGHRYGLLHGMRCNKPLIKGQYHFEHIYDSALGGGNEIENGLVICAKPCHEFKTNYTKKETKRSKSLQRKRLENQCAERKSMRDKPKSKWPKGRKIQNRGFPKWIKYTKST